MQKYEEGELHWSQNQRFNIPPKTIRGPAEGPVHGTTEDTATGTARSTAWSVAEGTAESTVATTIDATAPKPLQLLYMFGLSELQPYLDSAELQDQYQQSPIDLIMRSKHRSMTADAVEETDDTSESGTVYTMVSSDSTRQRTDSLGTDLAAQLYLDLGASSDEDIARVSEALPRILQLFAFKIGKEGQGRDYRHIVQFIHRYRSTVANNIVKEAQKWPTIPEPSIPEETTETRDPLPLGMQYGDKVKDWYVDFDVAQNPNMPLPDSGEPEGGTEGEPEGETEGEPEGEMEVEPEGETEGEPEGEAEYWTDKSQGSEREHFQRLVTNSSAYGWLKAKLRNELGHEIPTKSAAPGLLEAVFKEINKSRYFSRYSALPRISAVFHTQWSPHSFFKEQEYGVPPGEAVTKALVLIGATNRAEGFSTLLVAVKRVGDIIIWHVISNRDGSYIYYHDKRIKSQKIEVASSILHEENLAELRHVVGWTSEADNFAGTTDANLAIRGSGLHNKALELEFEKATIGFSKFMTGNVSAIMRRKDKPLNSPQEGDYTDQIRFISRKFVTLYDIQDHKAVLLDGGSALLYLVRASLDSDERDGLPLLNTNDAIRLDESKDPKRRAMRTLFDADNIKLKLFDRHDGDDVKVEVKQSSEGDTLRDNTLRETKTEKIETRKAGWVYLKDRVTSIWWMLDHAVNQESDKELRLILNKRPGKPLLQGYEFVSLAHDHAAHLQFATPKPNSKGWLNLVRELQAVTIFGRGFGDIIQHRDSNPSAPRICPEWKSVPKGESYLSTSNTTLESIINDHGDFQTGHIIGDVYMDCPEDIFGSCHPENQRCKRVHVLVDGQAKNAPRRPLSLPKDGAVIIGHSAKNLWPSMFTALSGRETGSQSSLGATDGDDSELAAASGTSVEPHPSGSALLAGVPRTDASRTTDNSGAEQNQSPGTAAVVPQHRSETIQHERPSIIPQVVQSESSGLLEASNYPLVASRIERSPSSDSREPRQGPDMEAIALIPSPAPTDQRFLTARADETTEMEQITSQDQTPSFRRRLSRGIQRMKLTHKK
ncbi:hypothetical protein PG999_001427 [Apiospora kogelbergensis]|uniref:C3H1-type domain-containing protein n=1 Tax=Apiospora kogelbergensis TaxID=1337665 RepID=A0AAW0RES3_9PEZI